MTKTLISTDVGYEQDGRQCGYLRLPHSVHRSAYGWIPIPVVVIKNGEGPTALLISGNHGDEYEGQIALSKLCHELEPSSIQGRLIILTMANYPASLAGLRTSPIDNGNLNRSFPGNPLGTPTEMIADYIENTLLPMCDYFFDFHSGGSSLFYPPTLARGHGNSSDERNKLIELQQAFDAPYAWVFTSAGRKSTGRTAMGAANRKGVMSIMTELGGGGAVSPKILALTERGIKRLLHCIEMLPGYQPDKTNGTRELQVSGTISALDIGLFEPYLDIAAPVKSGDPVGAIHSPETPWKKPVLVLANCEGIVLCKRVPGRVERGDCLYQIATDLKELNE